MTAKLSPEDEAILSAASDCMNIAGPSDVSVSSFGSIPYVDTTALDLDQQEDDSSSSSSNTSTSAAGAQKKKRHRVLFVLGGPGAGKGTQSDMIVNNYGCVHLSVGELLRDERERGRGTARAELIEDCLVNGNIVPVEISLELLRDAMDRSCATASSSSSEGDGGFGGERGCRIFLVDGFPRNFDNLRGWTDAMPNAASCLGALVYDCPHPELERRILARAETSGRSDDNLITARRDSIRSRLRPCR